MRIGAKSLCFGAAALTAAFAAVVPDRAQSATQPPQAVFHNGAAGFVISHIGLALAPGGGGAAGCPNGLTSGYETAGEVFAPRLTTPAGHESASLEHTVPLVLSSTTPNLCQRPELGAPDTKWRAVAGSNVRADGIDLDGQVSRAHGRAAAGTCAHDDFPGLAEERGVDNQLFRAVGCTAAFQSNVRFNGSDAEMLAGSWGILITLSGVDDVHNDPDVEVSLFANADPIQLSPTREPAPNATYAAEQDPRFSATTHGRIVNGVLTTNPVDFSHHWIINNMRLERPLEGARLRLTFTANGGLEGVLAGYSPVDKIYDAMFGFRDGKDANGNLSPSRAYSSVGAAIVHHLTCEGAYQALQRLADGGRDPSTGRCGSISTQYRIEAVPAFVVQTQTHSVNETLDRH